MIHRLALLVGSIAAAAILALGFAATGFGPAAAPADAEQPTAAIAAAAADASAIPTDPPVVKPITRVRTTTVYVRPAPRAKVIHVTRRAPAPVTKHRPVTKHPKVVHATRNSGHHEDEEDDGHDDGGEHEREDD